MRDISFLTMLSMISIPVPGLASVIQAAFLKFVYMDILHTDLWLVPIIFPDENYDFDDEDQLSNKDSALNFYFD
jgi:hypothetical protein